jgi:hypothetical protein
MSAMGPKADFHPSQYDRKEADTPASDLSPTARPAPRLLADKLVESKLPPGQQHAGDHRQPEG